MIDTPYLAMRHAVDLARSGQCANWWTVQAHLRIVGYRPDDMAWTEAQRQWLDLLCDEARCVERYATSRW
jgi:hypothetical protein